MPWCCARRLGNILHTGDWKLDPDPVIGPITDEAALRRLGGEGVLAMVCDSTNVLVEGSSGSEAEVRQAMDELIGRYRHRVAVACFSSNVARIESVTKAGLAHGRHVGLVGRSLRRMVEAAQESGYLQDLPDFISEEDIGHLPRERVLMICTGSQGEPRSALARIARDEHPDVGLEPGDACIFSSRIIPGNEHAIGELHNALIRRGVEIVTEKDHFVHVSGHPARDELAEMYRWVKPAIAVPVHGELRHLRAHVALAESCQVRQSVLVENGSILRLAPGQPEVIGQVASGRLGLDGTQLTAMGGPALKMRQRMAHNGTAVATIILDRSGRLQGEPLLTLHGLARRAGGRGGCEARGRCGGPASPGGDCHGQARRRRSRAGGPAHRRPPQPQRPLRQEAPDRRASGPALGDTVGSPPSSSPRKRGSRASGKMLRVRPWIPAFAGMTADRKRRS